MIRLMRPKILLSVLVSAALLVGCGSGPSQVGSAVLIGDEKVELDVVQDELDWLLDNVPKVRQQQDSGGLGQVSRRIVRGHVVHELVTVAARRAGIQPDQGKVTELIDSAGGTAAAAKSIGVAPRRLREVATDQVLLEQLGKHYVGRLAVSFTGTMITSESPAATAEEQALDLAREIAAKPDSAGQLVRGAGSPLQRDGLAMSEVLRSSPELATSAVFGAAPGSVVVIQPSRSSSGWLVAKIDDRTVRPTGAGGQQTDARVLYQVGVRMLQPIAEELGVRVNPRYGVWDPTAMNIAASADQVAGHQLRSRTVRP